MATSPDPLSFQAPPSAAPGFLDYDQFKPCPVPLGSGACNAHTGIIRPFSDDQTARDVLRAIERGIPLEVFGGRLSAEAANLPKHPFENYLTEMAIPFAILVLEFEGTEHPRAYLTQRRMVPRLTMCPHVRTDRSVRIDGHSHPALCVYSGSIFEYAVGRDRIEQFLDQAATYLAKYAIWLRTRQLFRRSGNGLRRFVYRRKPNEAVPEIDVLLARDMHLDGYWPGPCAPSRPAQHLATIRPEDECWCWSGKPYGECCRPLDLSRSKQ